MSRGVASYLQTSVPSPLRLPVRAAALLIIIVPYRPTLLPRQARVETPHPQPGLAGRGSPFIVQSADHFAVADGNSGSLCGAMKRLSRLPIFSKSRLSGISRVH